MNRSDTNYQNQKASLSSDVEKGNGCRGKKRPTHVSRRRTLLLTSPVSSVLAFATGPAWRKAIVVVIQNHTPITLGATVATLARFFSNLVHLKLQSQKENNHQRVTNLNDPNDTFGHAPEDIARNIAFSRSFPWKTSISRLRRPTRQLLV